jgi:redox-sensitive bicupin YhaK (pirin superfamily)
VVDVAESERWTNPGFQVVRLDSIPIRRPHDVEVRLYSGTSGGYQSRTRNHVPVTLAEIRMESRASFKQEVNSSYSGFLYVISGSARVGAEAVFLTEGQVGWLDRAAGHGVSMPPIVAGEDGVRLVLYAGQPQGDPIVSHGPFIGDSREDIARLHNEYRAGRFERLSEIARARM